MGLLDSSKERERKPSMGEKLSKKEKEAQANITLAEVAQDPGALPTQAKFVQQSIKLHMGKHYPCDHREFVVRDQKGRPVKAARPMHVLCDAEYKGKRDHYYTQCLDCTIIKTSIKDPKCLIQELMYLERRDHEEREEQSLVGKSKKNLKDAVGEELRGTVPNQRIVDDDEYQEFRRWKENQNE